MRASFEGHRGLMWPEDNNVVFYGVRYINITDAIKRLLCHIRPSVSYTPWCYGNHRGIKDNVTGKIFVRERWFDNENLAQLYLKHVAI